jgi:endonuclease G, mitochondrial
MSKRRSRSGGPSQADYQSLLNAFFRLDPQLRAVLVVLLLIVAIAVVAINYYRNRPQQQQAPTSVVSTNLPANMLLGNPSDATADASNRGNYLMVKEYYVLSYNDQKGIPNWVSWRVQASDLGNAPRKRIFDPDTDLPVGFHKVLSRDYTGGGFDRGHMCPHSDRAANEEMSFATFVMTNIIPQAPNVNEKAWAQLEDYCRELVRRQHQHLYVISGPAGQGGSGSAGLKRTIANGTVTVPAECWKVVVSVPESGGDDDLSKINPGTRVITVVMPNSNDVGYAWAQYRTSPAEVERRTGLHFFGSLPSSIGQALREKVDKTYIEPPQTTGGGAGD